MKLFFIYRHKAEGIINLAWQRVMWELSTTNCSGKMKKYEGSGYCEYVDCRPLHWQEKSKTETNNGPNSTFSAIFAKIGSCCNNLKKRLNLE